MELRHLRYFHAVARHGHMTHAAAELGIQQPPLSQQIRALEGELGLSLFVRHPKGVTLTDAGRIFLEDAERILREVEGVRLRMERLASGVHGRLSVGFTSSAAAHRLTPEALRMCRARHPDIALEIKEDNAAGLIEAVAALRLDCGLLRVPVARPAGLSFEQLLSEGVSVALPVGHALARKARVAVRDLRGEPLILVRRPGAPGLYANLLALCEKAGFVPTVHAEVERMMTNLNLVAAGAGVSVVPQSMVGTHAHAIAYRPLAASSAHAAPHTLVRRAVANPGPVATYAALLREVARPWRA
jgi:DNA-binding transcriptional LysR family regulator